jgi:hypothetical protein
MTKPLALLFRDVDEQTAGYRAQKIHSRANKVHMFLQVQTSITCQHAATELPAINIGVMYCIIADYSEWLQ